MLRLLRFLWLILLPGFSPPAGDWPEFRGPTSDGHSSAIGLPLTWTDTQNVKWKTPIHGRSWSSPAVWGNQVWLTTATEDGRELFAVCVDRNSGKILLDRKVFHNPKPEPLGNDVNSYASPSPVIEDGRVYLHFGSPGTICLDTKTFKTKWMRQDLRCRHYRGASSSPVLFQDKLIVTFDGADFQYTVALNTRTGATVWKTDRSANWQDVGLDGKPFMEGDQRKAHSTPLITIVNEQPRLISVGAKAGYAYDPRDGKEIWKVNTRGFSASMRPVVGLGMAFITTGFGGADLLAVRLSGRGDVTNTNIVWRYSRMVPQKPSPVLVDDVLYANGRIYCFSEEGKVIVLKPGRKLEILAENQMADGFMASAAVVGKALILRTRTALYRIEQREARSAIPAH